MTILEAIQSGVSNYPIPQSTISTAALARDINLFDVASKDTLQSKGYRLLEADMKMWLAMSSNVSQGGVSLDILFSTKESLRIQANAVYREYSDPKYDASGEKPKYGYKGTRL